MLYCLGIMARIKSLFTFSTDKTMQAYYIIHVSNNINFFLANIFDPQLVESMDAEPSNTEGQLQSQSHTRYTLPKPMHT